MADFIQDPITIYWKSCLEMNLLEILLLKAHLLGAQKRFLSTFQYFLIDISLGQALLEEVLDRFISNIPCSSGPIPWSFVRADLNPKLTAIQTRKKGKGDRTY